MRAPKPGWTCWQWCLHHLQELASVGTDQDTALTHLERHVFQRVLRRLCLSKCQACPGAQKGALQPLHLAERRSHLPDLTKASLINFTAATNSQQTLLQLWLVISKWKQRFWIYSCPSSSQIYGLQDAACEASFWLISDWQENLILLYTLIFHFCCTTYVSGKWQTNESFGRCSWRTHICPEAPLEQITNTHKSGNHQWWKRHRARIQVIRSKMLPAKWLLGNKNQSVPHCTWPWPRAAPSDRHCVLPTACTPNCLGTTERQSRAPCIGSDRARLMQPD